MCYIKNPNIVPKQYQNKQPKDHSEQFHDSLITQTTSQNLKSHVLFGAKYFLLDSLEASFLALNVFPVQNTFTLHLDLLFLHLMSFQPSGSVSTSPYIKTTD